MLSGVAVAVALGALVSLHGQKQPARPASGRSTAIPGRQQLIAILGVLRRPQVPADLRILSQLTHLPSQVGRPDHPLVRYATTTPWGASLYLAPMKPPTRARAETLVLFSSDGGGAGAGDAQNIEAGQGIGSEGGEGVRGTRVTVVVPDGVASVRFVFPRQPEPAQYGAPVYRHSLTVTAPVHDNVVAIQVGRRVAAVTVPMIWYAADGHDVKGIGDLAGVNRVVPTPQPGPETALSRSAERDPSTPNRVWVTPRAGGPHTNFMVRFRVLLTDADYTYRLSGTTCPGITVNGGSGGGTNDLRGQIWTDQVAAIASQT